MSYYLKTKRVRTVIPFSNNCTPNRWIAYSVCGWQYSQCPSNVYRTMSVALTAMVKTNALANADEIGQSMPKSESSLKKFQISHANGLLLLYWCFMALRHISGHFGHGQLSYPHGSWTSLLGSWLVLSAHSFASNWHLSFLNQRRRENGRKNVFMTNLYDKMLPDVRIEPATVRITDGRVSDRATY